MNREKICLRILKSLHPAANEEALRVIKIMPDWKPASNNDMPCKMCHTFPFHFMLLLSKNKTEQS